MPHTATTLTMIKFTTNTTLPSPNICIIKLEITSANQPYLVKHKISIPYTYRDIITPFDLQGNDTLISLALRFAFNAKEYGELKIEDIIELVDLMVLQNDSFVDIDVEASYTNRRTITQ
ncbi:betaC1 protein [Vernonia crinkle betasatellite]|uniref:BetaC1 protein n=1 Tax=Vernonia crinkle betasatellite TaxID=1925152 RepID=A0A1L4AB17_9VIRU|nr:betaC1 protein [Vernonia crinkle betasatellite]API65479.1 betaC1 protein [Vernonia crinkle betasatellite]